MFTCRELKIKAECRLRSNLFASQPDLEQILHGQSSSYYMDLLGVTSNRRRAGRGPSRCPHLKWDDDDDVEIDIPAGRALGPGVRQPLRVPFVSRAGCGRWQRALLSENGGVWVARGWLWC